MQHAERRQQIDDAVQLLPVAPHPPDPAIGRCRAQQSEPEQRHEPDRQIDPQHDLARDGAEAEILVHHIEQQMHDDIGERSQPHHPPHQHDLGPVRHAPQRRDRERDQQEADRPEARAVDELHHRAGPAARPPGTGRSARSPARRRARTPRPSAARTARAGRARAAGRGAARKRRPPSHPRLDAVGANRHARGGERSIRRLRREDDHRRAGLHVVHAGGRRRPASAGRAGRRR